jgi:hypothetical protein
MGLLAITLGPQRPNSRASGDYLCQRTGSSFLSWGTRGSARHGHEIHRLLPPYLMKAEYEGGT